MPHGKRKRIEAKNSPEVQGDISIYPPQIYKHYLACPFPKHNPDLYLYVNNACTTPWGFKSIPALNDHIQRVHSLKFGCIICKKRFTKSEKGQSKTDAVARAKVTHRCEPRDFTNEDPEWLSEEQELRLARWKEGTTTQEGGGKSWRKIYMCLFGTEEDDAPSPFYNYMIPKHLVSTSPRYYTQNSSSQALGIDPSLAQSLGHGTQGMGDSGALENQHRYQLDRHTLDTYEGPDSSPFKWSNHPALDSGYSSRNVEELQELDTSSSQNPSTYITDPVLHAKDKQLSVKWALGNSGETDRDINEFVNDEYLNIEEYE